MDSNLSIGSAFLMSFTSNENYEIFNTRIDLGEQLYLLPRVKIIDMQDKEITVETERDSTNLVIYKKYYGEYSLEEITRKENIGKFQ